MSTPAFTPGPWLVWHRSGKGQNSTQGVYKQASHETHLTIALCDEECVRIPEYERVANANLIAAAPSMYEALDLLVRDADKRPGAYIHADPQLVEKARDAIRKARGEVQ